MAGSIKYSMERYFADIDKKGLKSTWHYILSKSLKGELDSEEFILENYGELYEIGLAHINKIDKKELGKYYTPRDVSIVMAKWLKPLDGEIVCDVGCGVGNLILSYLDLIDEDTRNDLIDNRKIYLYDMDDVALEICKYSIAIKYGRRSLKNIKINYCDFLDNKVRLPKNSKVISNPPYYKISKCENSWKITKVIEDSKELYSAFMEKIIKQSVSSVIITPYSFIGSGKFYSLRKLMNKYNGFIVSFDNVPGNIFNGRKHGVFNSNSSNSVRAAITVVENKECLNGFRISPLLRFATDERFRVLDNSFLESTINNRYQIVDSKHKSYYKCHKDLLDILDKWVNLSNTKLGRIATSSEGKPLYVPTTCRYFTVGAMRNLSRNGKRIIYIKDKERYNFVYCLLNSTFAYWYWRLYDGGINCPLTILNNIPVFYDRFTPELLKELNCIAGEMQSHEKDYLVYKMNAKKKQENIKFPKVYRDRINDIFFRALEIDRKVDVLNKIHSSSLFLEQEGESDE